MNRLDSLISGTVAISLLLFSLSTQGANLLRQRFKPRYKKHSPSFRTPPTRDLLIARDRLAKAGEVILSYFDTREFARRALGRYWSQRTPAEQQEFVRLFTALVARTYSDEIDQHSKDVKLFYDKERVDGTDAKVDTRVLSEEETVSINYMMHQVNGRWLIYDVQIDDVSIVFNYRSQFANVLNKSSYADLIQLIRSKLQ
jgi:phospholipid transport system substrate-binding protein